MFCLIVAIKQYAVGVKHSVVQAKYFNDAAKNPNVEVTQPGDGVFCLIVAIKHCAVGVKHSVVQEKYLNDEAKNPNVEVTQPGDGVFRLIVAIKHCVVGVKHTLIEAGNPINKVLYLNVEAGNPIVQAKHPKFEVVVPKRLRLTLQNSTSDTFILF